MRFMHVSTVSEELMMRGVRAICIPKVGFCASGIQIQRLWKSRRKGTGCWPVLRQLDRVVTYKLIPLELLYDGATSNAGLLRLMGFPDLRFGLESSDEGSKYESRKQMSYFQYYA